MVTVTGGDLIHQALRALDVTHVFGIPSAHNIPIYDAILRRGGIQPIYLRHEQGAVHAADGYARMTGKLGVAITSTGPGAANAVPGLYEAGFASSRVLMLTGQINSQFYGKGKGEMHEAEKQLEMLRSVCRRVESPRRVDEITSAVINAGRDAMTGRPQPAAVEIPIDLQYGISEEPAVAFAPLPVPVADGASLDHAARIIAEGGKRVVWAGGGVLTAGASLELQQLAEALNAPVFTSLNGRGAIPEDHPLAMGPLMGFQALKTALGEADVLIAVGTRFQASMTRNWSMELPGKLVHIDVDPGVIGLNYPAEVAVRADARASLRGLLERLKGPVGDGAYLKRCQVAREEVRSQIREQIGPDYAAIMDNLRAQLPRDGNFVSDATVSAYLWGNRLLPILRPNTFIGTTSMAIGPGLPLAMGAAVGTGRKTVVIQGDGGFMLSIGELASAAQYKLPVIVCLFNDRGYGVLRGIQSAHFEGRTTGVDLMTPDFAKVAEGMGVLGLKAASSLEFTASFSRALAHDGPALIDIDMTALVPMLRTLDARR
ncbi:MAG: thiamine pyrophosphate-binding protein [Acidobacteria bacterium]|nr:thiamine pyrophosphate-binding protein [Acidobacteriota bacterium]